jgi:hAT family protein
MLSPSCPTYTPAVLDPRITYEGLKLNFTNDPGLLADPKRSKDRLQEYYEDNYATFPMHYEDISDDSHIMVFHMSDFMSHYSSINPKVVDKLDEYFKIKHKDFKKCDPLRWWRSQQEDWPNLYHLACDVLCIPGLWFFNSDLSLLIMTS